MKSVLIICPFSKPNIGGVESHIDKLVNYLSRKNCKIILVTYKPLTTKVKIEVPGYEKNGNVEIYRVAWFGRGWFPKIEAYFPVVFLYLFPGLFIKSLSVYLKRHSEVDAIHAHGFIAAAITKIISKIFPKRTVISTHAFYRLKERKMLAFLIKWLLKDFDAILAAGEHSKAELTYIGLSGEKIKVHPNWVDVEYFNSLDKVKCREVLGFNKDDFIVLFIGRLIEIKGVLVLLEVAKRTTKKIKFVFIGDGPLSGEIKKAADENKRIIYRGKLEEDALVKAYNIADLFVSPVLYEESFATVFLESLSCGVPVITAKRGCLPFFLSPEVADLLEEITICSVLEKIEHYFGDLQMLEERRSLCREYALKNFTEKNADVILNSYN